MERNFEKLASSNKFESTKNSPFNPKQIIAIASLISALVSCNLDEKKENRQFQGSQSNSIPNTTQAQIILKKEDLSAEAKKFPQSKDAQTSSTQNKDNFSTQELPPHLKQFSIELDNSIPLPNFEIIENIPLNFSKPDFFPLSNADFLKMANQLGDFVNKSIPTWNLMLAQANSIEEMRNANFEIFNQIRRWLYNGQPAAIESLMAYQDQGGDMGLLGLNKKINEFLNPAGLHLLVGGGADGVMRVAILSISKTETMQVSLGEKTFKVPMYWIDSTNFSGNQLILSRMSATMDRASKVALMYEKNIAFAAEQSWRDEQFYLVNFDIKKEDVHKNDSRIAIEHETFHVVTDAQYSDLDLIDGKLNRYGLTPKYQVDLKFEIEGEILDFSGNYDLTTLSELRSCGSEIASSKFQQPAMRRINSSLQTPTYYLAEKLSRLYILALTPSVPYKKGMIENLKNNKPADPQPYSELLRRVDEKTARKVGEMMFRRATYLLEQAKAGKLKKIMPTMPRRIK